MASGWHSRLAIAGLALIVGTAAQPPVGPPTPPVPAVLDPFERLDLEFRELYSAARARTLAGCDPIVVVERDDLTLIRNGRRLDAKVIPPVFHRLKSVAHVPLSIYVTLAPFDTRPLSADLIGRLRSFRSRIAEMVAALDGAGFGPERRTQAREILQRSGGFLDDVFLSGHSDPTLLERLTRDLGPLVLAMADDAAKAQIDAYHAQVSAWRRQLTPAEWGALRVVILGVAMPRKHNTAVQYFAKLLGLPGESRRLVYAEVLADQTQALNLLATHQLDSELSSAFFADSERMEFDLLGNAAATYLDTLNLDR